MWSVLTDYSYVPNLDICERLKGGTKTRYRLRQAGCSQSLFLRLEASAVLDVQEVEGTMGRRELRFSMIESESFKVRILHPPGPSTQLPYSLKGAIWALRAHSIIGASAVKVKATHYSQKDSRRVRKFLHSLVCLLFYPLSHCEANFSSQARIWS